VGTTKLTYAAITNRADCREHAIDLGQCGWAAHLALRLPPSRPIAGR